MEHSEDATEGRRPGPADHPGGDARADRMVDEQVDESFPASDPPAGWAGEDPRDLPDRTDGRPPAAGPGA